MCTLWPRSKSLFILGPGKEDQHLPRSHGRERRATSNPGQYYFCSHFIVSTGPVRKLNISVIGNWHHLLREKPQANGWAGMHNSLIGKGVIVGRNKTICASSNQPEWGLHPHLSAAADYIISPLFLAPVCESSAVLFYWMESWLKQPIRNSEIVCYHTKNRKHLAFYFDQKVLVQFACTDQSLNKYKEQKAHCCLSGPVSLGKRLMKNIIKTETFNETKIML